MRCTGKRCRRIFESRGCLCGARKRIISVTGRQGRLWRIPSESWTPSRSRSAAALSLIRSSGLSRSGTILSGAGLPKPRHRRGRKSHIPREKSQTGNGHNRFQSRSPWTAPLKEGATIHHLKVVCCALRKADDCPQRSGSCQSSQGKLHFPCAGCRQLPLCGLAARKHLALQVVPVQQVYSKAVRNAILSRSSTYGLDSQQSGTPQK